MAVKKSILIVVLLLLIGAIIILTTQNRNQNTTNQPIPPQSTVAPSTTKIVSPTTGIFDSQPTQISPDETVHAFYAWYFDCSRNGGNCDFASQPTVDAEKIQALISNARGYNPIVCSQNAPTTFRIDRMTEPKNNSAKVYVIEAFGGGVEQQVIVDTKLENNAWKVVNITCPQ